MTLEEFRAKAYEILTAKGFKEIDGEMYFPESSILDMLEWMHDNANTTPDVEKVMSSIIKRLEGVFKRS